MAGYWDLMDINVAAPNITNIVNVPPDTCTSGNTAWGRMVVDRIFGLDNNDPSYGCISSWSPTGGDALVVRYADPDATPSTGPYIQTLPTKGTLSVALPLPPGGGAVFANHEMVAHAYYVANAITTDCGNVPVFAREYLKSDGTPSKESLVNGVERLRFQYGVDTDNTGSVNRYLNANQVLDWRQVRAVHFWVLVRASCPEGGYTDTTTYQMGGVTYTPNDNYRRELYSSTVALRNYVQ